MSRGEVQCRRHFMHGRVRRAYALLIDYVGNKLTGHNYELNKYVSYQVLTAITAN